MFSSVYIAFILIVSFVSTLSSSNLKYHEPGNQDLKHPDRLGDIAAQLYMLGNQRMETDGQSQDSSDESFMDFNERAKRMGTKSNELRNRLISKVAENMGMSPMVLLDKLKLGGRKDVLAMKDAFVGSRGR